MPRTSRLSRFLRFVGSVIFTMAGLLYLVFPPNSSNHMFQGDWVSVSYGLVFAIGGVVSCLAVAMKVVQVERFGVLMVVVAGAILSTVQVLLVFAEPVTWTRGGGAAVYVGFTLWALERWWALKPVEEAIKVAATLDTGSTGRVNDRR